MNIQELVEKCTNVTVAVDIKDLVEFGNHLIAKTKRDLEQAVIDDKAETYLSPQQVANILGVNLSSLWRWGKRGYLNPLEIGGKRRYKKSQITALLNNGRAK
jgi:hypothetical protein